MAHDHEHTHDTSTFYLEQIFTIGACAALALVTCLWWFKDFQGAQGLILFIAQRYHPLVLGGGLGLLALVAIRAAALWISVDEQTKAKNTHNHDHHECDHEHAHDHHHEHAHVHAHDHHHEHVHEHEAKPALASAHAHDHHHGHDHEHGWAPWRYVVLLLPVVLYFLNLPNAVFSSVTDITKGLKGPEGEIADKGFAPTLGFKQLEMAAMTPELREENAGKTVKLVGQYAGDDPKRFSLNRYRINCCAADAVALNAAILIDPNGPAEIKPAAYRNQWVEVTGQLQFLTRPNARDPKRIEYLPAVIVFPKPDTPLNKLVKVVRAPADPYVN
jgi:uncharacterized membrane protein YcgQ (UPF0703/DUF1980 family)